MNNVTIDMYEQHWWQYSYEIWFVALVAVTVFLGGYMIGRARRLR